MQGHSCTRAATSQRQVPEVQQVEMSECQTGRRETPRDRAATQPSDQAATRRPDFKAIPPPRAPDRWR